MYKYGELVGVWNSEYTLLENCIIKHGEENILSVNSNTIFDNIYGTDTYFIDPDNENFQLSDSSYAINSGKNNGPGIQSLMPEDIAGNPRVFDDAVDKIDIGAYEFQAISTANRPPSINNPGTRHIFISSSKEMIFNFSDVDETDNHTLSVVTDNPNINVGALSAQENNSTYTLEPVPAWSGTANIILSVTDNHGARDVDTFTVVVSDTVNYDITENTLWDIDTVFIGSNIKVNRNSTGDFHSLQG
jgi:hypothetical protein